MACRYSALWWGAADAFARRVVVRHVRGRGIICVEIAIVEDGGDLERRVHARVNIRIQGMVALVVDNGSYPCARGSSAHRRPGSLGSRPVAQAPAHDRGGGSCRARTRASMQVGVGSADRPEGYRSFPTLESRASLCLLRATHGPDLVGQVQQTRAGSGSADRVNAHGLHERQVGATHRQRRGPRRRAPRGG